MLNNSLPSNILLSINKYEHFIKYCIIGVCGVSLDFLIFYILTQKLGIFYQYANIISISCGIMNNFFFNAFWNFKKTEKLFIRFIMFFSIGMLGLLLSAVFLYIFIETLLIPSIIAKGITIIIITMVQFTLNSLITFGETRKNGI